jgi:hypothetical protein
VYVLAEKLWDVIAKNSIIDPMLLSEQDKLPAIGVHGQVWVDAVRIVYGGTPKGDKVRDLFVDLFIDLDHPTWVQLREKLPAKSLHNFSFNLFKIRPKSLFPTANRPPGQY